MTDLHEEAVLDPSDAPLVVAVDRPDGTPTRMPRPEAVGLEADLAAANDLARASSVQRLRRWFPDHDFEHDAQNVDARQFARLTVSDELLVRLGGLGTIDQLLQRDQIFAEGGLTFSKHKGGQGRPPEGVARPIPIHGAVGLTRSNRLEHQERPRPRSQPDFGFNDVLQAAVGQVSVGGLAAAIREQWTTVVNGVDRQIPDVAQVCADLGRVIGCSVNCNAYLSQGVADGFGSNAHWDRQDVLIVQIAGSKTWTVHEPEARSPQEPWFERSVPTEVVWEGVLQTGEALFIPRGWGHQVHQADDLSVHLTIGINRLETHHLLDQLAWEAGTYAELRADVPFDVRGPISSEDGSIYDTGPDLASCVAELGTSALIERAVGAFRSHLPMRLFPTFSDTFRALHHDDWAGLGLVLPAPCGVAVVDGADGVVAVDGRVLWLDPRVRDAFATLTTGQKLSLDQLPMPAMPHEQADELRRRLAAGLVAQNLAQVVTLDTCASISSSFAASEARR